MMVGIGGADYSHRYRLQSPPCHTDAYSHNFAGPINDLWWSKTRRGCQLAWAGTQLLSIVPRPCWVHWLRAEY